VRITASARKHGVSDDAMRHAIEHATRVLPVGDVDMYVGSDQTGRLLEVGVLVTESETLVIHAMPARRKFLR